MRHVRCSEVGMTCEFVARGASAREAGNQFWLHAWAKHRRHLDRLDPPERARLADLVRLLIKARGRQDTVAACGPSCADSSSPRPSDAATANEATTG